MKYRVIYPYPGHLNDMPVLLPIGTIVEWWDERGFYLSHAVNGICVPIAKWAVEAWEKYFQKVEEGEPK